MLLSFVFLLLLLLLLLFLLCLYVFSLLLRVGLRFSVKPPFRKTQRQLMLAMAAIILPLHFFPFPFTRETKLCSYYTGSFLSYKSHYRKRAQ